MRTMRKDAQPLLANAGSLVEEKLITIATTSVTFSNLDILADGGYEIDLVMNLDSARSISMYINDNTTAANYINNELYFVAGSVTGAQNAGSIVTGTGAANRLDSHVKVDVARLPAGNVRYEAVRNEMLSSNLRGILNIGVTTFTVTNVTSITFTSSVTDGISVGSAIRLYRKLTNPVLALSAKHLNNLVEEKVLAADASSVTFTGLDSSVDGDYLLNVALIGGGAGDLKLYLNSDTVSNDSSYYQDEVWRGTGSADHAVGAQNFSKPKIGTTDLTANINAQLCAINGEVLVTATVTEAQPSSGVWGRSIRYRRTASGITKLTLSAAGAYIKAGSIVRLYKSNGAQQLVPYAPTDITSRASDYYMKPGETVHRSYTNASSVPLNIATVEGVYEMQIVGDSSITPTSGASAVLRPNNATYTSAFRRTYIYAGSSAALGNTVASLDSMYLDPGGTLVQSTVNITTFTKSKSIVATSLTVQAGPQYYNGVYTAYWADTTTVWSSLGTIVFPFAQSGKIIIKRIL